MSRPDAFQWSIAARASMHSTWPIISSSVANPSDAMISRTSSATNSMKLTTKSAWPENRSRSSGF